jgi:hypothetical protein
MSVSTYAEGDAFTIRVVKYHTNNPDRKWANSYEAVSLVGGSEDELLALGETLVAFEKLLHYSVVLFSSLLISTWTPDSTPYNPSAFISSPLTGAGARDPSGGDIEPINVCMNILRVTPFGRFGHLFYRGALGEGEVSSPAGKAILTSRSAEQTILDAAVASSSLDDYLGVGATTFRLSMIGSSVETARGLLGLSVGGVSTVPFDHAWFNRTTTP